MKFMSIDPAESALTRVTLLQVELLLARFALILAIRG